MTVYWLQVEAAQKRAPFSERKEAKRKRSDTSADLATDHVAVPPSLAAPVSAANAAKAPDSSAPIQAAVTSGDALPDLEAPQKKKAKKVAAAPKDAAARTASGAKPERKPKTMPPAAIAKQVLVRTVALGNLLPDTSAQALAYAQSVTEVKELS